MAANSTELPPLDPSDPFAREAQTFPRLTQEMSARVAAYGREEVARSGVMLYERGQRGVDFFLVLQGCIEVFDQDVHGTPHIMRALHAGEFAGELHLFNDRPVLVSGRAGPDTRVVRVGRADFRRMVASEPDIGEIMMRAFILRRVGFIRHSFGGVAVVGPGHSAETLRIQRFMTRNAYPYRLLDTETDPDAGGFLTVFALQADQLPVVVMPGDVLLRNPDNSTLARALGLLEELDPAAIYDLAVIGAGPAGLAAAVYGASEGLSTVVFESTAPGGQAGTSSRIENYLGFPTGISGQALAGRAFTQAQKFGARLAVARTVTGIDCAAHPFRVQLESGESVQARAVVIATGARYRKLELENYAKYEGQGIHYAATAMEANLCRAQEVAVVGGGNSAGQAAVFLAGHAEHVHIIVRGPGLAETMSDYLVQRIVSSPRMTLHTESDVTSLQGDQFLRRVGWTNRRSGSVTTRPISNLFLMIGAEPNTQWLNGCLPLDAKGFIPTGRDEAGQPLGSPFATSRRGIFAVGDVRSGSVKRVASGVGEGSVVVQAIHEFLHSDPSRGPQALGTASALSEAATHASPPANMAR